MKSDKLLRAILPDVLFDNFDINHFDKTTDPLIRLYNCLSLDMVTTKLLYRNHFLVMLAVFIVACVIVSCSHSQQHAKIISDAERIVDEYPDSALVLLTAIDPVELFVDSLKAKYHYVRAFIHNGKNHPMLSDSLISFSADYYRDKDLKRSIRSTTLLASYKFIIGESETAFNMLDSLSSLKNVPDSLLIDPLRTKVQLTAYDRNNEDNIRRLISIDKDPAWHPRYQYWLYFALIFNGKSEEALEVMNELSNSALSENDARQRFIYEYEKLDALVEANKYEETLRQADSLISRVNKNSALPYILLWKSLAKLNMHDFAGSAAELAVTDSLTLNIPTEERRYFSSFALIIRTVLDYQRTGKVSFIPFSKIYNGQRDNLFTTQDLQEDANREALEIENRRLILKSKNERQTDMIIIIILGSLIICGALIWYANNKRRKAFEILERNEVLQKLVEESKASKTEIAINDSLRKAMLQQLGIIKMVAETPTEQNRDMLRRLSSIESDTNGALVNWANVYEIIDRLYSDFYTCLHRNYGEILSEREEQIIVLMLAGFSTKEIGVITSQTTATIYTRKSSIRKKLGVPEKEDILAFVRQGMSN